REAQVEAEGDVRHDEDDGDSHALDSRIAQLLAGLGTHPFHAQGRLGHDLGSELAPEAVHQLIALRRELHLDLVIARRHEERVLGARPELEALDRRELLLDVLEVRILIVAYEDLVPARAELDLGGAGRGRTLLGRELTTSELRKTKRFLDGALL